jgi:hypothetical protein
MTFWAVRINARSISKPRMKYRSVPEEAPRHSELENILEKR